MGADVADIDTGGGGTKGIRELLQSSSAGGFPFWGRDVGTDPPPLSGASPEQLSVQGCATAHQEAAKASGGGELEIYSAVGSNIGIRIQIDWVYVTRRKNTVAQYITMRPIMDLCERSVKRPVKWVSRRWWEQ